MTTTTLTKVLWWKPLELRILGLRIGRAPRPAAASQLPVAPLTWRSRRPARLLFVPRSVHGLMNLDFCGSDSSRFLVSRGGIPRSTGNSPENQTTEPVSGARAHMPEPAFCLNSAGLPLPDSTLSVSPGHENVARTRVRKRRRCECLSLVVRC